MANFNLVQWNRVRGQGKSKYLLIHWVLSAAIPVAVILPIIMGISRRESILYFTTNKFMKSLLFYLILCIIISLIAGNKKWKKNEKLFEQAQLLNDIKQ